MPKGQILSTKTIKHTQRIPAFSARAKGPNPSHKKLLSTQRIPADEINGGDLSSYVDGRTFKTEHRTQWRRILHEAQWYICSENEGWVGGGRL